MKSSTLCRANHFRNHHMNPLIDWLTSKHSFALPGWGLVTAIVMPITIALGLLWRFVKWLLTWGSMKW